MKATLDEFAAHAIEVWFRQPYLLMPWNCPVCWRVA